MREKLLRWQALAAPIALLALTWCSIGQCADWPARPVTLIVPFAAGGSVDVTARQLAQSLGTRLGQAVIVENRAGAAGLIGADYVAKAAPTGYTVVMASAGIIAVGPHLYAKMPFDPVKDLIAVTPVVQGINVMVVPIASSAKSVKDFVEIAKTKPGKLNFGSSGVGASDDMATELFSSMAGIKMTNIPYKGGGPAMIDLVAGHVDVMFSAIAPAVAQIKAGRLRALGVTTAHRLDFLPEVPTVAEAGVPGYESVAWYGLFVPAKTPRDIVLKLNQAAASALQEPAVRKNLTENGLLPFTSSPEEFTKYVASETEKWGKVVRDNNIKIE
jgi:tripartite-type tricarboxylate transporter receptor subunit TctC